MSGDGDEEEEKEMTTEEKQNINADVRMKILMDKLQADVIISKRFLSLADRKVVE